MVALSSTGPCIYTVPHHAAGIAGGNQLKEGVARKLTKELVKVPPVKTHCPASMV